MKWAIICAALAACAPRAPDFALATVDGRTVRLSDLRGRVVLLSFWATWCAPCKIEMPWLVDLDQRYRTDGLEIVGIAMDGEADEVARFAGERGAGYTIVLGDERVAKAYGGLRLLPETVFVGRDGAVLGRTTGLGAQADLDRAVRDALGLP